MSKDKAKTEEKSADGAAGKPKKTKLIILVVVAVLLIGGGGGAAWFFMAGSSKKSPDAAKKEDPGKPPIYVSLDRKTYNLPSADGEPHFLMLAVDIRVADQAVADRIKQLMPEILNGMLMLISSKTVEDLTPLEGKKKLSDDIVSTVNAPLHLKEGEKGATDGLFTEFVIQ